MSLTIEVETRINGLLDEAFQRLDDQVVVANGPCVNALLDLYGSSDEVAVRRVCTDALRRISRVTLVRADEFRADLQAVAAAAASSTIEGADLIVEHAGGASSAVSEAVL